MLFIYTHADTHRICFDVRCRRSSSSSSWTGIDCRVRCEAMSFSSFFPLFSIRPFSADFGFYLWHLSGNSIFFVYEIVDQTAWSHTWVSCVVVYIFDSQVKTTHTVSVFDIRFDVLHAWVWYACKVQRRQHRVSAVMRIDSNYLIFYHMNWQRFRRWRSAQQPKHLK